MGRYLLQRLATIIPTLILVSMLVFGLQQLLAGDPAIVPAGEDRDPAAVEELRRKLNLDKPLPVRYLCGAGGGRGGALGGSRRNQKPVTELIVEKLPVPLQLASMAIVIALLIGVT